MSLTAGDRLGPYEIVSLLGKGGMGEVYRAHDTRLGRDVAVKVSAERFSERFAGEARAVAALDHPHICTLFDVGPNHLVMEFREGAALQGPLPTAEALRLATQIAEALEAAHAKGITHRDLKPGNILVTRLGVTLLDFGLAKLTQVDNGDVTQTIEGTVLGTPAYMSPEQASGKPADARSDIFSFGAVLYEVLAGRGAFREETQMTTIAAVLHKEPEPLDAPAEIVKIVARCLRKSPADRFQNAAELRAALAAVKLEEAAEAPSIAVLPFANLSSDKDNEYFSDGLAEEILNGLTPLPGLRVVARASAFAFRGREHAIGEVGEKLKVANVLHGSVRRSGNRIRINVQLIKVSDESQLWSERYDRELRDVFDIQDEIAQAIVAQLQVKLGTKAGKPLVKRYTENPEVHSLYLKGNFHLYRLTPADMEKAHAYLTQAMAMEPGHAAACFQLADFHIACSFFGFGGSPLEEWPQAREAARKAVAADQDFAEAHAALSLLDALSEYRWSQALNGFETALRLNPASARTHFWRAWVFHCLGRPEEALAGARRAVELDPLFTLYHHLVTLCHLSTGQIDKSVEHSLQTLEIDPNYTLQLTLLGEAYSLMGRHEEAIALLEKAQLAAAFYFVVGFLGWAYVRGGRRADAERLLARLEETRRQRYVSTGTLALLALAVGDMEAAFRWANAAVEERDPNLPLAIRFPEVQPLRTDPRCQDVLRRMNLQP